MIRPTIMFVAGFVFLALGVRRLANSDAGYLLAAGNLLTGAGLLLYAWLLKKNGKSNVIAAGVFILGCILTVVASLL
jgi:hypothetical protein